MDKKYWVPALEKADGVLRLISEEPYKHRLIDLVNQLGIHKSSMYSLLHTLEALKWIDRDANDTYAIGSATGRWGDSYSQGQDIIASFHREASITRDRLQETIQLAKLEGNEVLYLAKEEAPTMVRLASGPGMKFPAHVTALGKVLLSFVDESELDLLYPSQQLISLTEYSLKTKVDLVKQLRIIRDEGIAFDRQEVIVGFSCVSAPILSQSGEAIAAVSCSMPQYIWERKKDVAKTEISQLAGRLSQF
ncbi:IclR family transcriptional regulator [Paenibacillus endoradicis]|uniref:IclR family transcriptional regulator n=1 Tax=Paenibacillus endoradicis TaxID=2972487 RepID=UPI002158FAC8|nr:IclR family transcriptional regulator [Paenibacillus endoradicis]MCR8655941.1 IclR family transcriptional regulator [Paenibacillus endoradicis]MCR8658267.1 IclR family transcriptional regulator [Paenibacillus endoradicis]